MASKAVIEKVEIPSYNTSRVIGIFTDDSIFKIPFNILIENPKSLEDVRAKLAAELDNAINHENIKIPVGDFDLTPPIVTPPDPPDPVIIQFLKDYELLLKMVRLSGIGLNVGDISAQLAIVQKGIDSNPTFIDLI